jgi:hypothetical protein
MVSYEENAAWNIPPTKIRVINNLLRMSSDLSKKNSDCLQRERDRLLALFHSNKWTVPSDLEGSIPTSPPSQQLLKKTLARGLLVEVPRHILKEAAAIGRVDMPSTDDRTALLRVAQFDPDWEKYLVK